MVRTLDEHYYKIHTKDQKVINMLIMSFQKWAFDRYTWYTDQRSKRRKESIGYCREHFKLTLKFGQFSKMNCHLGQRYEYKGGARPFIRDSKYTTVQDPTMTQFREIEGFELLVIKSELQYQLTFGMLGFSFVWGTRVWFFQATCTLTRTASRWPPRTFQSLHS